MRSGACYQREPLAHRTDANAGGSLRRTGNAFDNGEYPTPSATPYGSSQNEGQVEHKRPTNGTPSLEKWAKDWPTPRALTGGAESAERKQELGRTQSGGGDLQAPAELWATPTSGDEKASGSRATETSNANVGTSITDQIRGGNSGRQDQTTEKAGPESRPRLNPRFVEGLMGLPPDWTTATASDSSGTVSCPSRPPSPSASLPGAWASMTWAEWVEATEAELDRLEAAAFPPSVSWEKYPRNA